LDTADESTSELEDQPKELCKLKKKIKIVYTKK
jgi:hypothetical protein